MGFVSSLMATLGLNAKNYQENLELASHHAKRVGREIGASLGEFALGKLGLAAGVAGIGMMVERVMETAERIHELSKEFQVSTDTIQIWDKGAKRVGMTAEDVGNAMNRLRKALANPEKHADALLEFGINLADVKGKAVDVQDILNRMMSRTEGGITNEQDVAGMDLMGKSGAKILSAMKEIQELGPIPLIKEGDIEKLHQADEKLKEVNRDLTIGAAQMLGGIPDFMDRISNSIQGLKEFFGGRMSWNDARRLPKADIEGEAVSAPLFDLKGRPITQHPKSQMKPEPPKKDEIPDFRVPKEKGEQAELNALKRQGNEIEKERNALAEEIYKNHFKTLTTAQQIEETKAKIAEHEKKAVEFEFGGSGTMTEDTINSLKEKKEAEKERGKLKDLQDKEDKERKFTVFKDDLTSNQRIGALAHSPQTAILDVSKKSENHLSEILKVLKDQHGGAHEKHANHHIHGVHF